MALYQSVNVDDSESVLSQDHRFAIEASPSRDFLDIHSAGCQPPVH